MTSPKSSTITLYLVTQRYKFESKSQLSAYVGKHSLFFDSEKNGNRDMEITVEDIERLRRMWKMQDAMSDNAYHKQLEGV